MVAAPTMIEVPKSGWSIKSSPTVPTIAATGTTKWPKSRSSDCFLTRRAAKRMTTANFANSDGWKLNGPNGSQRVAP